MDYLDRDLATGPDPGTQNTAFAKGVEVNETFAPIDPLDSKKVLRAGRMSGNWHYFRQIGTTGRPDDWQVARSLNKFEFRRITGYLQHFDLQTACGPNRAGIIIGWSKKR